MRRAIDTLVLLAVLAGAGYAAYIYRDEVTRVSRQVEARFVPCQKPISYSVGSIGTQFGISRTTLVANLKEAEAIWDKPSLKDLFEYKQEGGDVTVNLVYDDRQAASDLLKAAGVQIDKSKSSYDALKARYDSLFARVQAGKARYLKDVAAYQSREDAYNAEVESWNARGGASPQAYARLQQEKAALESELEAVNAAQARLNDDIDTENALATTLNQLIVQLNLNVGQYNQTGAARGEFEEGLYESAAGRQKIDIYEYSNHVELVRVLAHEMGHALGLEHVADAQAIMYKINQGKRLSLTEDDIAALNAQCASGFF